nr:ATP synthase F0 subunit 6 [Lamproglena orientalis]WKB11709.1 ATP synthase F0 subunit 6 [Lamproglena orientalis]
MSHLFSVFDPSTGVYFAFNWVSGFSIMLMLPSVYWLHKSMISTVFQKSMHILHMDLMMVLGKFTSPGISHMMCTLFIMILLNNFMGLLPYVFTCTSHMVFTLSFALPMWLGSLIWGFYKNSDNVLGHLVPLGTPGLLMPFMVIIELISVMIRPITLAVRLMANMVAGHLLLELIGGMLYALNAKFIFMQIGVMALMGLEMGVAMIQSYVFTMLLVLYFSEVSTWKVM